MATLFDATSENDADDRAVKTDRTHLPKQMDRHIGFHEYTGVADDDELQRRCLIDNAGKIATHTAYTA